MYDRSWSSIEVKRSGWLFIVLIWPAIATATDVDVNWSRLFAGEVMVKALRNEDGVHGVRALFAVTAPPRTYLGHVGGLRELSAHVSGHQSLQGARTGA